MDILLFVTFISKQAYVKNFYLFLKPATFQLFLSDHILPGMSLVNRLYKQ